MDGFESLEPERKPRKCWVRAKNEAEALEGAAELLYREVQELEVLRSRKGQFHIGLRFVEARLSFATSEDHRTVVVQDIDCPRDARAPTVATVTRQLSLAGVCVGVDHGAISEVLERFAAGDLDRDTPIAVAEEPSRAVVGRVHLLVEPDRMSVVAGSLIGEWEPSVEARPGRDVFGNPLKGSADEGEAGPEADPGEGCRIEDGKVYATRYGAVKLLEQGEIEVVSGLTVDEQSGEVRMSIWPSVAERGPITVVQIREVLADRRIAEPCVHLESIRAAVKQAWSRDEVVEGVCVARALPPIHGSPQRLVLSQDIGSFLRKGEEALTQRPAVESRDGVGLFGEAVAARPGAESAPLEFGEGLQVTRDRSRVLATAPGTLQRKGDTFFLEPAVRVSDDGLSAYVDLPPLGSDGLALQEDEVLGWLEAQGVVDEVIDRGGLRRGMAVAIRSGVLLENCLVAIGRPPVEAWAAEFRPRDIQGVTGVLPGDELARVEEAEPSVPGLSVLGAPIQPEATGNSGDAFRLGEGCEERDGKIVATTYGQVRIKKQGVSVEQGWQEDSQAQTLTLRVFQQRIGGLRFTADELIDVLLEAGFDEGCLNRRRIRQALQQNSTVDVVVGQATDPENPSDALLEIAGLSTGFPVFPGERIASVTPSSTGKPGKGLRGEPIWSTQSSRKISLVAGGFCTSPDDGETLFSQAYGIARLVSEEGPPGDLKLVFEVDSAIAVDESRQSCRMDIFPENAAGELTGVEKIVAVLCNSGIIEACVDRAAIAQALANSRGEILKGVLVAYGRQPTSGEDWEVKRHVGSGPTVVFPGDCIAEVSARIAPEPGFDLEGRPLYPDLNELGMALQAKQHCELSEDGRAVYARTYGRAEVNGLEVRVVPGFRLSPLNFSLMMDIFPTRADGTRIASRELVEQALALGVRDEFVREEAISSALKRAWESEAPQWHVEVARGRKPEEGTDGRLQPLHWGEGAMVFPGEPVVRLVPERQPVAGLSVFGEVLPAGRVVSSVQVEVESGCEQVGEDLIVSTVYGRPFVEGARVLVQPSIYVSPDGMRLSMDIAPKRGSGEEVTAEELCALLVAQGFDDSLIPAEKLQSALDELHARGGMHWDFEVCTGLPPIEGRDGHPVKDWYADSGVFPGEIFARFVPHVEGVPGKTVDGRLLRPQTTVEHKRIRVGEGAKSSPDGLWAQASVYGEPCLGESGATVVPGIRISEDGHEVRMDIWPHRRDGSRVSAVDLKALLVEHGVDPSLVDEDHLEDGIRLAEEQASVVRDRCVARSREAKEGEDGDFELFEDRLNSCVFAGDRFGRIRPPKPPEVGLSVLGKLIPPERGVQAYQFVLKDGLRWDEEAEEIVVETYGRVEVARGRITEHGGHGVARTEHIEIWVENGLRFNDSRLSAHMDIYPQRIGGEAVEVADLVRVLEAHGVESEAILERALQSGRRAATRQWSPQEDLRVARGTLPKHGRDGRLNVALVSAVQAGERGAFGRIDFREQNSFLEVKQGELLAHLVDPTKGVAGRTVNGEVIEARDGSEGTVEFGAGVVVRDDIAYAACDGVLTVRGSFMDVVELVIIDGDVDYRTGHVRVSQGSVRISGSVLPGFEVSCPDDIEIGDVVEGATIVAGGNVVVRGGVVSGSGSESVIRAGGEITVGQARNATLEAKGSILVQKELLHCEVVTEDRLLADRKPGVVSGGQIRARRGVVACQLGSSQWTPTILRVGGLPEEVESLQKALSSRRRQRVKLHDLLGGLPDDEALEESLPSERSKVQALCAQRADLRAEIVALEQDLAVRLAQWEAEPTPMITVKQSLFPRVVLNFSQAQFNAENQLSRSRFFLDASGRKVEVLDLGAELPSHVNVQED